MPQIANLVECEAQGCVTADADAPVLRRVKVLGLTSQNRRRYLPEAAQSALPLYEGRQVYIDHPDGDPLKTRPVRSLFGVLKEAQYEDGTWANLHYNPAHPMAAEVKWWADNYPDKLGLSHNAVGQGRNEAGVFVVEKIVSVKSVDLVTDPATTKGLFESREQKPPMKVKAFFEAVKWPALLGPAVAAQVKRLMEEGYMDGEADMPAGVDEAPADHEQALKDGFCASCEALIDKALEGEMEPKEALAKLKELLTAHAKLAGKEAEVEEEEEEPENEEERAEMESVQALAKKNPGVKSLLERLDSLEAKDRLAAKREKADKLIKEARLPKDAVSEVFLEQLMDAADDKAMKKLVEDRKALAGVQRPKSRPAGGGSPVAMTNSDFAAAAKKR